MTNDMTVGNPTKLIFTFALPLIIGNIFQQLYSMVDTLIVGRTIGVSALAAVGATGAIAFLIIGFVYYFSRGISNEAQLWKFNCPEQLDVLKRK